MSELKSVAAIVASEAPRLIPQLVQDPALPTIVTSAAASAVIGRVVTQDQAERSKRVWSAVLAVLTAVLSVPEVQALLGPWAPVATAVLSAGLAAWSKVTDPRPTR